MSWRVQFALPLCLIAILSISERVRAQDTTGGASEAEIPTAPVEFDGTELLRVRGVSSLPAAERARLIGGRLENVAADKNIPVDSLHVVEAGGSSRIVAGNRTVMTIIDADAALEQVERTNLASIHLARMQQAITEYRAARSAQALRRDAANSFVATVILALSILVLVRFWRLV